MAEITNISWADATLSFWIGCTAVGPACDHCYAEAYGNRFGVKWGPRELRRKTMHWLKKARTIERKGKKLGRRQFVFSNSLSDIFDNAVPIEWLAEAFKVMAATPHNVYLLLTKRGGLIESRTREALAIAGLDKLPENIAFGITVVTQAEADRDIPKLLRAKAALKPLFVFLSMEPLLERVDLTMIRAQGWAWGQHMNVLTGKGNPSLGYEAPIGQKVDWVITGHESGPHARPSDPTWAISIQQQCERAGVAFHHKQNGEWAGYRIFSGKITVDSMTGGLRVHDHGRVFKEKNVVAFKPPGDHRPSWVMARVGRDNAGRDLMGVIYDARPEAPEAA